MQTGCLLRIVFSIIGFAIGGPIGLIAGFLLGGFLDNASTKKKGIPDAVLYSITALSAEVMKSDGVIQKSELYLFKNFMVTNFGNAAASKSIDILKDIKDLNISIEDHCLKLNSILNYTERLEITRYLIQLAFIDGDLNHKELSTLESISLYLQIRQQDFIYIKNTFFYYNQQQYSSQNQNYQSYRKDTSENDYAILGVKSTDSNEDIKKAYRRLAVENHPDKIEHLGETARKQAEQNFSRINEAYQRIKKQRSIQ